MNERRTQKLPIRSYPRLPARVRWTLRALVTLPLLSLLIASAIYFAVVFRLLRANLVPIAEGELTRQTGHEVRIGGAEFSKRGALVLTNIAIANKATFAAGHGEATLRAKRLTVDYNLNFLLFDSGNAAHAIGDVTLDQPTLLVERYTDGYNFSDLLKPKSTKISKPFVGRIIIHHGLLRFRDFQAPANIGARPALNTLANLEGVIDLQSERNVYFDVHGNGTGQRFAALSVNGDVSRQGTGRYRGHVVVANADAAYWTAYFKAFPQAHIASGRADVDVTVAKLLSKPAPGLPLDLSGHIAIRNATIAVTDRKLIRLPLQNLTGTAGFTSAGIAFNTHLSLAGQPLAVSGTIFDFAHAQVAITADSPALDPARLALALPVLTLPRGLEVSPGPVNAEFTGTAANPTITVSATLPAVTYAGNHLTSVQAQAIYANKVLSVPRAMFRLNGTGQAALRATVDTTRAKPVVLIAGTAQGVNLAELHLPPTVSIKGLNLGGIADTQFIADNQNRPLSVVANVSVANLHLRATTLKSITGRVAWTQGKPIVITRAFLRDASGAAAVSGLIPAGSKTGRWDLTVRTARLDVASFLRPYSRLAFSGLADFQGRIVGPANAPQVVGTARLIEPRFGRYAADLIGGQVTASAGGVRLRNVIVRRFPAEAQVNGTVTSLTAGNPVLSLGVKLSQGDVQDFLKLAEQASASAPKTAKALTASLPNLTGTAEGNFQITGHLKSPIVSGHALVSDATVGEFRLDQVAADLRYDNGALSVKNGVIQSGPATLIATGTRTASGAIAADFAASHLDIARFHRLFDAYGDVTGTASFSGRFGGTPQSPHVALTALTVPDLIVDNQKFAPLSLAGRYDDGILTQTGAPWQFVINLPNEYAAEADKSVAYQINSLRLSLPTASRPNQSRSLALSAAIPTTAPERLSHIFATIRGSRWARTPAGQKLLAQIARLPQPISGSFALPRINVSGPLDALTAQADLSAGDLVLGDTRIGGLTSHLQYTAGARPSGAVTAQAKDLLAGGVAIGAASADIGYQNRIVTVHQFRTTSERAFLDASGTANLDGDIAANLDASNIPLALLGTAYPAAAPILRVLPREISALSVNASGPTRAPSLIGSISLSNPEGAAPGGPDAPAFGFDRIRSGAITLASATPGGPRVLTVNDLAAFKGGRLVATLSGSLPVPLGDLMKPAAGGQTVGDQDDLHADLKVQDLSALALFSPGLVDSKKTGGQLSASANFGGGQLSGLVTITNASVGLTGFDTAANKINGIVVLADNKARIQSFGGQSTKGGTFALTGSSTLTPGGSVDMRLATKDLTVDESSKQNILYQKFSSGVRAKINGALTIIGPWLTPAIATPANAPIVVSDASGTLPSASTAPTSPSSPSAFDPFFDVAIQLGGGRSKTVSVRSALLRADAAGSVLLSQRLSAPTLRGHLVVARGQFILPPSTLLKIVKPVNGDENTVDVNYPVEDENGLPGLQTHVDLTTESNVSISQATLAQYRSVTSVAVVGQASPQTDVVANSQFGNQAQRYTITAHIHGILNAPDKLALELTSDPGGLSHEQMLAALVPYGTLVGQLVPGGTGAESALEASFKEALGSVLLPRLLSPLTEVLGNAIGGVVDVTYAPNLPVLVQITKNIGPRLEVTYSRSVGARTPGVVNSTLSPPQYTLKLGYNLNNHLQLGVSTDDQRDNTISLESVFRF